MSSGIGGVGTAIAEWRSHWKLAVTSMLGLAMSVMYLYSMGIFIAPLSDEFGWSRVQITSALTIVSAFSIPCSYFVGLLVDRVGARRVGVPGSIAYCLAFAALALVGPSIWQWWITWVVIAMAEQFVRSTVWTSAVVSQFKTSRGLALAMTLTGVGLASTLSPIIGNYFIDNHGWRAAYMALAGFWGGLAIPLSLFYFYSAKDRVRLAGRTPTKAILPLSTDALLGVNVRDALTGSRYWRLTGAVVIGSTIQIGLTVHFVPAVAEGGLGAGVAATMAGLIGLVSIFGRLSTGYLLDRLSGPLVGAVAYSFPIFASLMLLYYDGSVFQAAVIACILGLALGAEVDVGAYMMARYFGVKNFGALFGGMIGLLGLATGGGPVIAAWVYDSFHSYAPYFWVGIPVCVLASIGLLTLGPYPRFEASSGAEKDR